MAKLEEIIHTLGDGEVATWDAGGLGVTVFLRSSAEEPEWSVWYRRQDVAPHEALTFGSASDVVAYFEAADMSDGWQIQHGQPD